ncbi:hypothetical protein EDD85DRAFT_546465 [Armillaria nabsnona]|nr:hypothetical protein EDD85DRAFT_546465 [Armillaria nabsnona]
MPTIPIHTADMGTVYTGPYPYRQGLGLLVYGTVYGMGVARKTRSVIRHLFWQQKWLCPPCTILFSTVVFSCVDMLYFICIPPMISSKPINQNVPFSNTIFPSSDSDCDEFPCQVGSSCLCQGAFVFGVWTSKAA